MQSDGPYISGLPDNAAVVDKKLGRAYTGIEERSVNAVCSWMNEAYAEGRKAVENYTEKMLVCAKYEVRKCYEEIRLLEDKYARNVSMMNVYKIPPYDPSFDEKEHAALVEKGTLAVQVIGKSDKDFRELVELANNLYATCSSVRSCDAFYAWKKARGIE